MRIKPNLFFIGAPKSGTTSIANYLSQHPDILVSSPKETCFHILEYEKGVNYYLNTYFRRFHRERIVCDASIMNLYFGEITAQRIHKDFPNSKFLIVLRNPITRAYSDYCSALKNGLETLSFEGAFNAEDKRLKNDSWPLHPRLYFRRGLYFHQLSFFHKYFDRGLFKIMLYEDVFQDTEKAFAQICDFLEIAPFGGLDFSVIQNPGKIVAKSSFIQRLLRGDHLWGRTFKQVLPFPLNRYTKKVAIYLKQKNLRKQEEVSFDNRFLERMRSYYAESNEQLRKCYGLDVEGWNTTNC